MKKMKKHYKKFICGLVLLAIVASVIVVDLKKTATDVYAQQNTFYPITTSYKTNGLKILEVTASSEYTELGYFVGGAGNDTSIQTYTYGRRFNSYVNVSAEILEAARQNVQNLIVTNHYDTNARNEATNIRNNYAASHPGATTEELAQVYQEAYDNKLRSEGWAPGGNNYQYEYNNYLTSQGVTAADWEAQIAFALRRYGMIKPYGTDNRIGTLSEYPIYDSGNKGLFGQAGSNDFVAYPGISSGKMIQGHYETVAAGSGTYKLGAGYTIATGTETPANAYDSTGHKLTALEKNYIYKVTSVSANQIPVVDDPTVSGNDIVDKYEKIPARNGIPEGIMTVTDGTGDVNFVYQENLADIYYGYDASETNVGFLSANRYYRVGDWIKEYILGDATLSCNISYKNVTLDQLTAADINNYDLIYISGTAEEYAGMDMSTAILKELYNQSAIYHKAIIMDYELYNDADGAMSNLDKLALLLWQEDQELISEQSFCSACFNEVTATETQKLGLSKKEKHYVIGDDVSFAATLDYGSDGYNFLKAKMMTGYNGNLAINNVYVYNHHYTDFQSSKLEQFQVNALGNIANGDFNSLYVNGAIAGGFQAVVSYISYNNEDLNARKREDGSITVGTMAEGYVTPAIVIQYILSYRGEDLALTKASYNVLEIEPTREFRFNSTTESKDYALETGEVKDARKSFISQCLNSNMSTDEQMDLVSFTSITVDEFNTLQTDLLRDYDVIYIGSQNSTYYKHVDGSTQTISNGSVSVSTGALTSFSNTNMIGNVYYGYGDVVTSGDMTQFYSSRDLTEAKLTELKEYLQGGGLVIGASDLIRSQEKGNLIVNPTAVSPTDPSQIVDHGRMDDSSNMYEFFRFAAGQTGGTSGEAATKYFNCISEGDLIEGLYGDADVVNYLNRERVTLQILEKPTDFSHNLGDNTISYLVADKDDGKYYLDYQFIINSSSAVLGNTEYYEIHFYQDVNADGRFTETEELHDYKITLDADDSTVTGTADEDGVTHYNLNNGVVYNLRRNVPSDEGGIINWCIEVEKVSDPDIVCREKGYTAIKPREQKYINVLQIVPDNGGTINLESLLDENSQDVLKQYLNDLVVTDQYEISARTVTVSQFEKDAANAYSTLYSSDSSAADYNQKQFHVEEELWQYFFSNFERTAEDHADYTTAQIEADEDKPMSVNMVILGFGDEYTQFTSLNAVSAIREYIASGKPLLTSNNVVGKNIFNEYVMKDGKVEVSKSATLNAGLLNAFAQDRYGLTNPIYNQYLNPLNIGTIATQFTTADTAAWEGYVATRESSNLAIGYVQHSGRSGFYANVYPYTNTVWSRTRTAANSALQQSFINASSIDGLTSTSDPSTGASRTYVDQMNDGQIAHYPYTINGSVTVSKSHAQYFQLDLDTDSDKDGNSDTVVWYTLGDMADSNNNVLSSANIYSVTPGDGINNYYIYNSGNVTFTGFGANGQNQITDNEAKLFVNTLVAAYEAGIVNPVVSFYETSDPNGNMLDSIAVPYDNNVTGKNNVDSSIQLNERGTDYLYKFVNPNTQTGVEADGTKVYFKITDTNLIKDVEPEDKYAKVYFYMEVTGTPGTTVTWKDGNETKSGKVMQIQLNDNTIVNVVRIPITIYNADFSQKICNTGNGIADTELEVGTMYGFYAPMSYLNEKGAVNIYIQANTGYKALSGTNGSQIERPLGTAYDMFTLIKQDLLKLD